jgi:hypothetical protein
MYRYLRIKLLMFFIDLFYKNSCRQCSYFLQNKKYWIDWTFDEKEKVAYIKVKKK